MFYDPDGIHIDGHTYPLSLIARAFHDAHIEVDSTVPCPGDFYSGMMKDIVPDAYYLHEYQAEVVGNVVIKFRARGNADAKIYLPLRWQGPEVEPIADAIKRIARVAEDAMRMVAESNP